MDMHFKPTDPGSIRLTLQITATVNEWQALAASVGVGITAGTDAAPQPNAVKRTPHGLAAADAFARAVVRMAQEAESVLTTQKNVTGWGVSPRLEGDEA